MFTHTLEYFSENLQLFKRTNENTRFYVYRLCQGMCFGCPVKIHLFGPGTLGTAYSARPFSRAYPLFGAGGEPLGGQGTRGRGEGQGHDGGRKAAPAGERRAAPELHVGRGEGQNRGWGREGAEARKGGLVLNLDLGIRKRSRGWNMGRNG